MFLQLHRCPRRADTGWTLFTGGGDGFGSAIVDRFHQESWKVIFIDIDATKGKAKTGDNPGLVFVEGDVSKRETWEGVLSLAVTQFGRLDVVINNAGE